MKYHITITDNETGETIRDFDTDAIIAGVHNEGHSASIVLADCNTIALLSTIRATKKAVEEVISKDQMLEQLTHIADRFDGRSKTETEIDE